MEILLLYYSLHGHTASMAQHIARGIDDVPGASTRLRTGTPGPPRAVHVLFPIGSSAHS